MGMGLQPDFDDLFKNRRVVALLSGGLDSSTLLFAAKKYAAEVRTVSFFYGQRHRRELDAARNIGNFLGVPGVIFDLSVPFRIISEVSRSSLISDNPVPDGHYAQENMVQTIVPNRNMIMASMAIGFAQALGYDTVAIAAHAGDHFVYPDCRPDFLISLSRTALLATEDQVQVLAPFAYLSKTDIVIQGSRFQVPFDLTYSCYKGGERHCGTCGTCTERIESFRDTGIPDPTQYDNFEEGVKILDTWAA